MTDKLTQKQKKNLKILRDNWVSAQKAGTIQQTQLPYPKTYPDAAFSNAVHFPYYASLQFVFCKIW